MKKVVLFFAVSAAVALASCGGNNQANTDAVDTTATVTETVEEVVAVVDSAATVADSTVTDSAAVVK